MAGKQIAPPAFIAAGIIALRRINGQRHLMPKCGAMSKTTGQPCRQMSMENGRCYYHGGRTPKGKDWHKPQWPKKSRPDAEQKMVARLRDLERAEKQRQTRLAKMTPDERAAYDKWKRDHPIGTPAQRETKRRTRKQNEFARECFQQPTPERPADPKLAAIEARIAELRARIAARREVAPDEQKPADDADPCNLNLPEIFG